ncbi:MAG: fumarate hydratase C-terminal domain-containing protein [Candidatus Wallbacteria bacterium]|nr:fumarate hydratase C-terminal domain-containing protein [Candidatus Wallbacteria bacterium]
MDQFQNLIHEISHLKAGGKFHFSGTLYTLRDQTMAKIKKDGFPDFLKNQIIYFCGPSGPLPDGRLGSCGPTTSKRFDPCHQLFMENSIRITIGKGRRTAAVESDCRAGKHFYFVTYGGLGAYLSSMIQSWRIAAYPELGTEAIFELQVADFPMILAYDGNGGSAF